MTDAVNTDTSVESQVTETTAVETTKVETPAEGDTSAVETTKVEAPAEGETTKETPKEEAKGDPDWATIRERVAKGDEKLSKRLARYSSIDSVVEALIAAQAKISDGSLKSALPKDATPEQIATWREENGIPASPKDYDLTLPDGVVLGDEDKPVVDSFLESVAHPNNMTPDQVKAAVAWNLAQQEQAAIEQAEADLTAKETGLAELEEAWGSEAKLNKNMVVNLINQAPGEGTPDLILGARLADGTPLASHPNVIRWLADVARTVNPTATVVPGSGANAAEVIDKELENLNKLMADKDSEYWKGPSADRHQARYRQLVDVKQKIN
jgi:hypothetical protein